jgi:polyisoprenyl-phosphate glycosyltransferase
MGDQLQPRPDPALLSFVLPMYNEAEVLPHLAERLTTLASTLPCAVEWVVVNDGSRDGTGDALALWSPRASTTPPATPS